jgi:outer membrane PBP1 activator LpoA protein
MIGFYYWSVLGVLFLRRNAKRWTFIYIFLLASCASQPNVGNSKQERALQITYEAEKRLANKKYRQASELFVHWAKKRSQQAKFYQLKATQSQCNAGQDEKASKTRRSVDANQLTMEQCNQLYLLSAQLYLNDGNAVQAAESLNLLMKSSLTAEQKKIYYESSAFSYALTGQLIDSVHERVLLSQILNKDEEKLRNQQAIMALLDLIPLNVLEEQVKLKQSEGYLGWVELAMLGRRELKGTPKFEFQLSQWAERYLSHPAQTLIASEYFLNAQSSVFNIRNVAVFLPESGIYAEHANAVKKGFMAAYYQQAEKLRPNIRFYDTTKLPINLLYQQAVDEGAQLIIGPLNKATLRELVKNKTLNVAVLGLNYAEELSDKNLYQFALSPIDEVNQVVEEARLKGYQNALILTPDSLIGERIAGYFQSAWETAEGKVLAVQKFTVGITDFSEPVKAMLNVDESEFRRSKLREIIGSWGKYNSRRRQDVDVIFMVANHEQSRLINPQFYHNRAGSIPIYGLSRVYGGQENIRADIDLNGVGFCTIPWLFEDVYQGELSMQKLSPIWKKLPDKFLSFIAFGIDAYGIIPHLNKLKTMQYQGATGKLLLNDANRVVRQLTCANFKQGVAQVIMADKNIDELPLKSEIKADE